MPEHVLSMQTLSLLKEWVRTGNTANHPTFIIDLVGGYRTVPYDEYTAAIVWMLRFMPPQAFGPKWNEYMGLSKKEYELWDSKLMRESTLTTFSS